MHSPYVCVYRLDELDTELGSLKKQVKDLYPQ